MCSGSGIPPKSAIQELQVNVFYVNDNTPKFQQQLYSVETLRCAQQVLRRLSDVLSNDDSGYSDTFDIDRPSSLLFNVWKSESTQNVLLRISDVLNNDDFNCTDTYITSELNNGMNGALTTTADFDQTVEESIDVVSLLPCENSVVDPDTIMESQNNTTGLFDGTEFDYITTCSDDDNSMDVSSIVHYLDFDDETVAPNISLSQFVSLLEEPSENLGIWKILNFKGKVQKSKFLNPNLIPDLGSALTIRQFKGLARDVYLRRKLNVSDDRKRRTPYRLSVVVEDQGPDPRSAVCQLLIRTIPDSESSAVTVQEPIERVIKIDKEIIKINAINTFGWSLDKNEISDYRKRRDCSKNKIVLGDSNVFNKPHLLKVNIFERESPQAFGLHIKAHR
ncbi:CaDHerin family [Ditylenchus destructor]|uniref:CaDHerin family n=1 Tax=Ditylenchus destructor TaxID=166010 RepID=A0AAD4QX94_9BILA|nr:CaDHerin family [Ditylenchus destructor]